MNGISHLLASSPTRPVRHVQFWLLVRNGVGWLEPLTTEVADGRRALCVFSFEEEAKLFLRLDAPCGWRARTTGVGELASVLSDPCREVGLVALDPLPQGGAAALNDLLCVGRERFVRFLLQEGPAHRGG